MPRTHTVSPDQPFVPVLLGGDLGTYSLAREFHEAYGVTSVVVLGVPNSLVQDSAFIELRPYPQGAGEQDMVQHLVALGEELAGDSGRPLLLLGSLDGHVNRITQHRGLLEPTYTIPYPDAATVAEVALKDHFYGLCERLGIAHPQTRTVVAGQSDPKDLADLARLTFPVIVKPSDSAAWTQVSFPGKKKVHRVESAEELETLLGRLQTADYSSPVIVQEYIPGGDENMRLCTFYAERVDGRTQVTVAGYGEVVLEDHSPMMLGNSVAIVTSVDEDVVRAGTALLEEIGWEGFAMIDAKLDPRDGTVKFFEMNPRLGRNHYYLTAAGFNPVRMYVERWVGREDLAPDTALVPADRFRSMPEGTQVLDHEVLYTTVPHALLRRHLHGSTGQKARRLMRARRTVNPLYYGAERHPKRWAYIAASMANHWRKFRAFPPPRG